MSLTLVKIEDGVCTGEVLFHQFVSKTPQEIAELNEARERKRFVVTSLRNCFKTKRNPGFPPIAMSCVGHSPLFVVRHEMSQIEMGRWHQQKYSGNDVISAE